MVRMVQYKLGDVKQLKLRPDYAEDNLYQDFVDPIIEQSGSADDTFTFINNGKIIGCMGVIPYWDGVGEVWCGFTSEIEKYKVSVTKLALGEITRLQNRTKKYHRLQSVVRQKHTRSLRLLETLGFEYEGVRRAFGPDKQDWITYARVVT